MTERRSNDTKHRGRNERVLQYLAHNGPTQIAEYLLIVRGQTGLDHKAAKDLERNLEARGLIVRKTMLTPAGVEWLRAINAATDHIASGGSVDWEREFARIWELTGDTA